MTLISHKLAPNVKKAIRLAEHLAQEHAHASYAPPHLLYAILDADLGLHGLLKALEIEPTELRNWALNQVSKLPKSARQVVKPKGDEAVVKVFQETHKLCIRYDQNEVAPLDILEALISPNVGFEEAQLRRLPIALYEVINWRTVNGAQQEILQESNGHEKAAAQKSAANAGQDFLTKYCEELNVLGRAGGIDPVLGRDRELKQLMEILTKRISPNVLIVGEPGVGKTSIVGGLVLKILAGNVSENLQAASIFSLDVSGNLVAGAFKGEIEERLKSILQAIKDYPGKAILFIDEIHILLDEKGPVGSGVVNLLKPELSRGEITVIGATTQNEYQKYIEKDAAFNRRFSRLTIEEPDEITAGLMLQGLVGKYEDFHKIKITPTAITSAVALAKKYIKDKHLPASAIELMDFTQACAVQMNATNQEVLKIIEDAFQADEAPDAAKYIAKLNDELSELVTGRLEEEDLATANMPATFEKIKAWTAVAKTEINADDVEAITAYKTGIALGQLRSKEQEKLQNAVALLQQRVVGQDHVVEAVARGLKTFRANLKEAKEPGAIFFFTGPTGTGKTELAKAIAELLFDDEEAMMRFDMSEFQESHSVATLLGAPPGYAGYEEGGILVNNVRKKPYSVVLFDEIEKAHPDIYGIFLQMLTDGRLQDKKGKLADFSNTVIIFTSNAGAHEIVEKFKQGEHPTPEELKVILRETKHFKDEFLGRVDSQILPFKQISEPVARLILRIHYRKFVKLLKNQHQMNFTAGQDVMDHLIDIGFSPIYGARPLKNAIKTFLSPPLADKIIMGEIEKGDRVSIHLNKDKEIIWDIKKAI